ncbi:hypothetical protein [Shewanella sp. KCT]|uniref:hypothetical protein n=1 Tax=Shewanella sp. KCT TaxID=2569535 RepID=UPI0011821FEF|nr:hypothetical protein [Shewanella sp. KCT]TVP14798.1 hypothetical protein AYI87_07320 [Shewanella sp. KCT]
MLLAFEIMDDFAEHPRMDLLRAKRMFARKACCQAIQNNEALVFSRQNSIPKGLGQQIQNITQFVIRQIPSPSGLTTHF